MKGRFQHKFINIILQYCKQMNQDMIEKNYYQQLMVGHYLDVRSSDNEWKLAKIMERDKKYVLVAYDGMNKSQHVYLGNFKVAPLRMHTEAYTGFMYYPNRNNLTPLSQYKNHLQILQQTYLKQNLPNSFTITQYLRGELFVLVHSLLCRQDIKQEQGAEAMKFMIGFIAFVVEVAKKVKKIAPEYFEIVGVNRYMYLVNDKVALVNSLPELLTLLNLIIKAETTKCISIFKNRFINQQILIKFFKDMSQQSIFNDLFRLSDGNGKWLSFSTHKHIYFLLKKYTAKFSLPEYKLKDYQQVLLIHPFIIKQEEKTNTVEKDYVNFITSCLKEQTSFEAKLKALQQLKKILQEQIKLYKVNQKQIHSMLGQQQIMDHMLNQYSFNPQIFKRFIPILQSYCKTKPFSIKNVQSLFKLAAKRHESEVPIIYDIICSLAEFISIDILDSIYTEIIKKDLNNQQVLKFIKNFTIKAISNFSKQKSFLSSLFKRSKNSSKHGYYGLDLFFKQVQDNGSIAKSNVMLVIEMIKEIFMQQLFQNQRVNYMGTCVSWLQNQRNYGQALRIIDNIVSTFPASTYIFDSRKQILQKLLQKSNIINLIIQNLKRPFKESKLTFSETIKYLYDFVQNYYDHFINSIKIQHIEILWNLNQTKRLADFLKKGRGDNKKRYIKKIDQTVQQQILTKLTRKPEFYNRNLIIEEFQALDQIFVSFNLIRKKVEVSDRNMMRYLTPEMEGYYFYFEFLPKMHQSPHIQKIIKRTIGVFLRPKDERDIEVKINTWRMCLLKLADKLKAYPAVCLNAIRIFFELIEGRYVKQNVNSSGNIDILVSNDGQEKIITLARNCTIYRLRKQIMIEYNLTHDFTLYSMNMKRDISFIEEQEFSLGALPLQNKLPSISIVARTKEKHPHILAVQKFKELIEKEEMFYTILFSLNDQKIHQLFWKTVDLLPVNRQLVKKIQNCTNFNIKDWRRLLKTDAVQSLQYHLNIIYDLMERNKKWISLFYDSDGMSIITECLSDRLKQEVISERIINRCLLIVIKMLDTIDRVQDKLVEQLNLTLIAKLMLIFKGQLKQITVSIQLLNNIFNLLNILVKTSKNKSIIIQIELALKILTYGVFKPKNKFSLELIERYFQYYLINNYSSLPQKINIYEYFLSLLKIQTITAEEHCELVFVFFIDYMNTFIAEEHALIQKEQYMTSISQFVMHVLTGPYQDHSKYQYNHLLFGTFKLLLYTVSFPTNQYDLSILFQIILKNFLLNKEKKRIKNDTTVKLLYQCLKKLLFMKKQLINILAEQISPKLQHNEWRKNSLSAWQLESKRQERSTYCGLQNLGATCYINGLVQQLFMIASFRENFISIDPKPYKPLLQENQIYQLQNIFSGLKYSNKRSISTKKFCESFINYEGQPINPMVQSDSDQFFNALMQKIETFLKYNQRHDVIENTFQGKLSNQLNCQGCPHKSEKQQHFLSIGVNIRGKKCLQEALEGFVEGEMLDGDNAYFCQICQKKVRTLKRLCIKELPNILVIVLKRFQFNFDEMKKIKINSYLNFPLELNVKKYTAEYLAGDTELEDHNYGYSLRGTVIHAGTSEGGHYYSFARAAKKWYLFDDQKIQQIESKKIEEEGYGGEDKSSQAQFKFQKYKNAYILFYQKLKPAQGYQQQPKQIPTPYTESIRQQIITENNNADFLSVMLDGNFIRLGQNISVLQSELSYKFTLLYFHTVVLRDRNKEEHIPNYFRIIDNLLKKEQVSEWYLSQMNHRFFREFFIQSSRIIRFFCTSLLILALRNVKNIPKHITNHALFCLKKNGMTPFALIFRQLSKRQQQRKKLIQLQFVERIVAILLDQSNNNFKMIEIESFQSYFGSDSSEKEVEREYISTSLCQSLQNFDVGFSELVQINQKCYSRNGTKVIANILVKKATEQQLQLLFGSLEGLILKQGEYKRQQIQKYMFIHRFNCMLQEQNNNWRIQKSIQHLKKIIYESKGCYQPMETILREVTYIAGRNQQFKKRWKQAVFDKEASIDLFKVIKNWFRQAQRPQMLLKSDEFKRKVAVVDFDEKYTIESFNHQILIRRFNWMFEKETFQMQKIESDTEQQVCNKELMVRSKRFKIKEHLGLIKKVQIEGQQRWGILQKNQLDIYQSL